MGPIWPGSYPYSYLRHKVRQSWLSLLKPTAFDKLRLRFLQTIEKLPRFIEKERLIA